MKRFLLSVAAFFVAAAAFAQDFQQLPNDPAVRVGKLDNGMTYYIRHNDKPAQRAEFYLATNVGAIQETPDQDGLAHFLEHMCFNGTKNFPGKTLLEYLQSIGASFGGNINAATGVEETTYMLNNIPVTREGIIDTCLLVMHDYSHFVTCDPVEIDKERGVIIEERRARRNAAWRLHEQSLPYYYGDSKYAGCTLIGSQENLETFKPESLTNFYHTWYRPDLQALIVVGDIDVDSIEAKIKSTFADIPAAVDPKPKDVIKIPENEKPLIGVLTDPECSGSSIEVLWRSEADDEAYNSTDVGFLTSITKTMIAMIMAERFDAITSKPGAPFLGADLGAGDLCETCQATMGDVSFKDGDWEPAFRSFLTEVERMRRYGFSSAELQRAKDNILSAFEKAVEAADSRKNADFVRPLINNFFDNDAYMTPQVRYEVAKALLGQVPDMIFALAANALVDSKSISIVYKAPAKEGLVHPTPEQLQTVYDEVSASEIDAPVEEEVASEFVNPASLKGSKVKKTSTGLYGSTVWTLKNGVKVVVLPTEYKKDQILFTWYKNGGETLISDEDLVSFEENVYGLFQRNSGISKFSSNEASKMLAGKHLSVSSYISNIRHGISGSTSPKDLETALQIAYLTYCDPRFDESEYEVGIEQIKAVLPNVMNQPSFKLQQEINKAVYGPDCKRNVELNEETLEKANLATIERVYRSLFKDAAGLTAVFVGNIDLDSFKPLCEKYLGSIPKGKKATTWKDNSPKVVKGEVIDHFSTDMQTPKNTVIQFYSADMPYSVKTSVMLKAANYILDMIYVDTLREDEGGTYGASSDMSITAAPQQQARIQVAFETNPTQCEKLIGLAKEGLHKLANEGPTEEQMTRTLENFRKGIPEKRINNSYWLGNLLTNEYRGIDYDAEYEAAVNEISAEGIKEVLQKVLESGNFIEIVMSPDKTAERE
mgnify:FL=1